jgi:GTP-binding protein Era
MSNENNISLPPRAGILAVVGRANVGKSTLLNAILGEKISIVSPIAQTTRRPIRGILTEPRGQLVFIDTPGTHKATYDLGRLMNRQARQAAEGSDFILLVMDASTAPRLEDEGWMRNLLHTGTRAVLVLNKIDRGRTHVPAYRDLWLRLAEESKAPSSGTPAWFEVSAATAEGLPALLDGLFARIPEAPLLFPEEMLTDYPRKLFIADIIREKYFGILLAELPHAIAVFIEAIEESEAGWNITGELLVNKASQKGIVLGRNGGLLKKVQKEAAAELSAIYEKPVRLRLHVRVSPNWAANGSELDRLGYRL